ncbi:hypothetical protein HS7_12890 [Sulfolobales archaeon HS-7]|nr:hypothetical protein HS7_12890 [Sulfolobales archaeon HS-7]
MKNVLKYLILLILLFEIIPLFHTTAAHSQVQSFGDIYGVLLTSISSPQAQFTMLNVQSGITYPGNDTANITHENLLLNFSSYKYFSGTISVSITNNYEFNIYSQIPQLLDVILESDAGTYVIWAGFSNSTVKATGYGYLNRTGILVFQYLNGSNLVNVTFNVRPSYNTSINTALQLKVALITGNVTSGISSFPFFPPPMRYSPVSLEYGPPLPNFLTNYTIQYSVLNGELYPVMIWTYNRTTQEGNVPTINDIINMEFFGQQGTVKAYLQSFARLSSELSSQYSSVAIYYRQEIFGLQIFGKSGGGTPLPITEVGGAPVLVTYNSSNNSFDSSAYIDAEFPVILQTQGVILALQVNSSIGFYLYYENTGHNVTPDIITSTSNTTVNLNGKQYVAEEINVESSSLYSIFNVTAPTGVYSIYVQTLSGLVQVNPSNYFIFEGRLFVFSDPSSTYYIVYSIAPSNTSTTSSSSSTTTSSPTSTTSLSQTTQSSSASTTTSTGTTSSTSIQQTSTLIQHTLPISLSKGGNPTIYILIVIIVIVMIGVVLLLRSRR